MNISVITVSYNASSTISDCLKSVDCQTCPAEHIVIDGASTDSTLEAIHNISKKAIVVSEPDEGIYDAMNKGIDMATGDIIGILNADDFYASPHTLELVARVFENPDVMSCYGDLEYISDRRLKNRPLEKIKDFKVPPFALDPSPFSVVRYWKSGDFAPEKFYRGWMPPHPTFFVRKSAYENHGIFNTAIGSAADYELMLRLLLKERITTVYIPEVLVKMRIGGASNSTLAARLKANRMDRKAWEVNGLKPHPWTIMMKPVRKVIQYVSRQKQLVVPGLL